MIGDVLLIIVFPFIYLKNSMIITNYITIRNKKTQVCMRIMCRYCYHAFLSFISAFDSNLTFFIMIKHCKNDL